MDYASATPLLPEVKRVMEKISDKFENPSAIYEEGREVKETISGARREIAGVLGVKSPDIIFTSGGTESNNLAILGTFSAASAECPHIIISSLEHSSIREVAREVERRGGEVSVVEPRENGLIHPSDVEALIKDSTILVSVALANSDTGTIQPLAKIGRVVRAWCKDKNSKYPILHTDASQAVNYLDVNLEKLHVDLLTLDASKFYGPKGAGVLVVRETEILKPIIFGGGQERGLRSGTENTQSIVGLATALTSAVRDRENEVSRLIELKKLFIERIEGVKRVKILSSLENHLPNMVSLELEPGLLSELVVLALDREGVAVSSGSACGNLSEDPNESLVRFSFGRKTSRDEVIRVAKVFSEIMQRDNI